MGVLLVVGVFGGLAGDGTEVELRSVALRRHGGYGETAAYSAATHETALRWGRARRRAAAGPRKRESAQQCSTYSSRLTLSHLQQQRA